VGSCEDPPGTDAPRCDNHLTIRRDEVEARVLQALQEKFERIEMRRKKLIEMVMDGVSPSEVKDELNANAARRDELKAKLAAADAPPPLLHQRWPTCIGRR
jgi:hypothetical protein